MIGYIKYVECGGTNMSFLIKDDEVGTIRTNLVCD